MNAERKRIAFVSGKFAPPSQPGSPRSWSLTRILTDNGHRLKVYVFERNYMSVTQWSSIDAKKHGLTVIPIKTVKNHRGSFLSRLMHYALFNIKTALKCLEDEDVDILYISTPPLFTSWFGYILKILKGKPVILEIRDMHPEATRAVELLTNDFIYSVWLKIENFFRARMDLIVALTPTMEKRLIEYGFENTILVPNIFYQEDTEDADTVQCDYILKHFKGHYIVLYTGGLVHAQDLETIIRSASIMQGMGYSKIKFVFIGSGEKREKLEGMVKDRELKNVLIFDAIARKNVRHIQSQANALISAYLDDDFLEYNLPNKIFDYHGAGKPIIWAGKGDAADLLKDSGAGIVTPPEKPEELAKAVEYLYKHQDRAEEMGQRGRNYVLEHFDENKIFGALLKKIEDFNTV